MNDREYTFMCGHTSTESRLRHTLHLCPICYGKPGKPAYKLKMVTMRKKCKRCEEWFTAKKNSGTQLYCDPCRPYRQQESRKLLEEKYRQERIDFMTQTVKREKRTPVGKISAETKLMRLDANGLWVFKEPEKFREAEQKECRSLPWGDII